MRYCVIDFETTGLDARQCEIIEFAAVRVEDGELGLNLASLCEPHSYISRKITQITGITPQMTAGHPHFEELLPLLLDFIGDDVLVAHNFSFDWGFLSEYCVRAGRRYNPERLCTLQLARRKIKGLHSYSLSAVSEFLRIPNPAAHRALGDAMTTAQVLVRLLEM
ncbi:MAG: 3'-5' exonuclease [Oscillospiraceae bacterium]|nr:3'-5' exonuclease [Oscillospiraceae bacterium]